jgi:hypothetical protein
MTGPSDPESGQQHTPRHGAPDEGKEPEAPPAQFWYEQQPQGYAPPPSPPQGAPQQGGPPQGYAPPQRYAPPQGYAPPQAQPGQQPGVGAPPPSGYFGAQPAYAGYRPPPRPGPRPGVTGLVLGGLGAACLVVAFAAVNWFDGVTRGSQSHFSDVHDVLTALDRLGGVAATPAKLYFSWLGWALFAAALVGVVAGNLPSPAAGLFRVLGVLSGLAGIVLTFLAIKLAKGSLGFNEGTRNTYDEWLKHARVGFYLALGGFLLITVGALLGARRR